MASANRKTQAKRTRASRRRGLRGSGDEKSKATEQAPDEAKQQSPKPEANPAAKAGDGEKVSSLLETTSQEVKQLLEAADDAAQKIRQASRADTAATDDESGDGDEASTLIKRTNKEVRQVLESADEAAEKIREEAREEARQFVEDARRQAEAVTGEHVDQVSKLTAQVLDELSGVQEQLGSLRDAYDNAIKTMSADLGAEESEVWEAQRNGAVEDEEQSELQRRLGRRQRHKKAAPQQPEGVSEGARLLALQQLMAGVDAEVIEARLESEFGIENPRAILEWMGLQAQPERKPEKT